MIMILEGELYTTKRKIIRQNQSSITLFETPCTYLQWLEGTSPQTQNVNKSLSIWTPSIS